MTRLLTAALSSLLLLSAAGSARAADPKGFLETIKRQSILGSTVPENGDQNPYAIVVAPVSAGKIQKDDVLVNNFNNSTNLQGVGSTIVAYTPATRKFSLFAKIPRDLPQCPGGIGLSTAMTMLKSGWVIVGSAPSRDGTTPRSPSTAPTNPASHATTDTFVVCRIRPGRQNTTRRHRPDESLNAGRCPPKPRPARHRPKRHRPHGGLRRQWLGRRSAAPAPDADIRLRSRPVHQR